MAHRMSFVVLAVVLAISLAASGSMAAAAEPCSADKPCQTKDKAACTVCNDGAWKKLGRGICNVVTFPMEIPNQISRTNVTDGPMAAFTWGAIKAVGMTAFRALVGVYEIVTFPVPCPEGYKPILTQPEFFLEDLII